MSITLKHLEGFVWVAEVSSFKGAAERLNTTQPNISTRIAQLEALVGEPLFVRGTGSVSLTPRGRDLLPLARAALHARDDFLTQATADPGRLTQGTLRLGVTEMIVHSFLRPLMARIKADFPNLAIELTMDMAADVEAMLAQNQLDLALINGPFQFQAASVDLGQFAMVWVASPDLGLNDEPITQHALSQHPILTHARGTWVHQAIAAHFQGSRARLVPSSNLGACQQMALDGMGIAVLPHPMVARDLAAKRLVALTYDWHPAPLAFQARYNADHPTKSVATIAQIAAEVIGS